MRVAVVFLTVNPFAETINFANLISKETLFDVFIVADTKKKVFVSNSVNLIQISDKESVKNGYTNSNINSQATHIKKDTIAFDKMLYYFCEQGTDYDFVWVFEDDVFIPSVQTIKNLHDKYSQYDLITSNNNLKDDDLMDWHWKHIFNKVNLPEPYYYSMACAVGLSRNMLNEIKKYVDVNKKLFYVEVMLNTLAMQGDLIVCEPFELKSIVWMGKWEINEFLLLPDNVFHPKKEIDKHPNYRHDIEKAIYSKKKPKNNLPKFIKQLM